MTTRDRVKFCPGIIQQFVDLLAELIDTVDGLPMQKFGVDKLSAYVLRAFL